MKKRSGIVFVVVCAVVCTAMTACSTTEGLGKDVKNLGGNIEDSAAKNK